MCESRLFVQIGVYVKPLKTGFRRNTSINLLIVAPLPPTGPYLNGDNCSACLQEHCEQPTPLACLIYRQPLKGQP